MVLLKVKNPDISDNERTEVRTAASAAATSIDVDNTEGFSANDFVVVGTLGTENCEAVRITAVTDDDTLAVTALKFAHSVKEPVQKSLYDQAKFYSSADSFASAIATKNVDWQNPSKFTEYNDSAGTSSTTYKFTYYNSNSTTETDKSSEFSIPTYYCSADDVSDYLSIVLGVNEEIPTDEVVKAVRFATARVDELTETSFKSNTVTDEYHSGKRVGAQQVYFAKNHPIISVTSFSTSGNDQTIGPTNATYDSLTENDDFVVDKTTSRLWILDPQKFPAEGPFRAKISYTWGRSSVPDNIKYLTVLLAVRHLAKSTSLRNMTMSRESNDNFEFINKEIDEIAKEYRFNVHNV